jgi:hypothetical protein
MHRTGLLGPVNIRAVSVCVFIYGPRDNGLHYPVPTFRI